ncbi:MAG: hypothetical protein WCH96_10525 [Betaproteobacteria bacterium]
MPSIVIATEAFTNLLTVMLRARQAPDALAVIVKGNPEVMDAAKMDPLADKVLGEVVRQLNGEGRSSEFIS